MPPLTPESQQAMEALRAQLKGARGLRYWRSLDELADEPAFRRHLRDAMPQLCALEPAMGRRAFLKLLGASLAMAGLTACSGPPPEQIVPWVRQPEGMAPSLPQFYATTLSCAGDVVGVLMETHQGRPSKIEGNPLHPASLGATDARLQAAVLELWDPDRSQTPMREGVVASWRDFFAETADLTARFAVDGRGLRVLSGRIDSPTLAAQREQWLARFPGTVWHQYEPIDDEQALAGARLAFGTHLQALYHFDRAEAIVALDADFLDGLPGHLRYARDFSQQRKPVAGRDTMSRLYALEPTPTLTGANADHAWPLGSAQIGSFALELAAALDIPAMRPTTPSGIAPRRLRALTDDLRAHRGTSLLLAGPAQPAPVHALVHLINESLSNVGKTVDYLEPLAPFDPEAESLPALVAAMGAGTVDTLLVLDRNPAYTAASDLRFAERLRKVPHSIHLGLYRDETARVCRWHLPRTHALEAWSDARAWDGTPSLVQPVIAPLYDTRSTHALLAELMGSAITRGREIVRSTWKTQLGIDAGSDEAWQRSLRNGVIAVDAPAPRNTPVDTAFLADWPSQTSSDDTLELLFRPDSTVWDGRYANNAWLQECPKSLSQLTWGNAALISPVLAEQRGLANGDIVELRVATRSVQAPVWITPGQAAHSVTVSLGYGRRHAGHVGNGLGFDGYALRSVAAAWREGGLTLSSVGHHAELGSTQQHHAMEGRGPVQAATLAQYLEDPHFAQRQASQPPSFYPERAPGEYRWGMSIDLNSCIGCHACTIACQAENNIPVVGLEEVRRGREMHWIRVDRYYGGHPSAPMTLHQPVPCMMCEDAPCELVCPVGATVHDSEGLNVQVYNRCVGTRFCSNNCPYKVRRFNFLQYADLNSEGLQAQRNPDVTVRNRGVMEKCTYCIQRIETAHIAADIDGRRIADGEVLTACQAVCPTRAITFGDIADPHSAVSREKSSPRNYALLEELNTRPHTTYLAALRNPHPALEDES